MGVYDRIRCEYPLPDAAVQDAEFQTKSLHPQMSQYTITADGRLVHHMERWESVPEEERPAYGTPEWDDPLAQNFGAVRTVPMGDVEIPLHGDIRFYASKGERANDTFKWFEYEAHFESGRLQYVKRIAAT